MMWIIIEKYLHEVNIRGNIYYLNCPHSLWEHLTYVIIRTVTTHVMWSRVKTGNGEIQGYNPFQVSLIKVFPSSPNFAMQTQEFEY